MGKKTKRGPLTWIERLRPVPETRATIAVYTIVRLLVSAIMIHAIIEGNYENMFTCILTLILLMLPVLVEHKFGIDIPSALEITLVLFIFAAEILGEMQSYYVNVPHWDTILHTISGFIYAAVGFAMVDILNKNKRISFNLSPLCLAFVAFCFSMTIGALWEIFEFSIDTLFNKDMQKDTIVHHITSVMLDPTRSNIPITISGINEVYLNGEALGLGGYLDIGLIDTMKDLIVNLIGAVVFSIIGYFHVKNRGKSKIAKMFVPVVLDPQEHSTESVTETMKATEDKPTGSDMPDTEKTDQTKIDNKATVDKEE